MRKTAYTVSTAVVHVSCRHSLWPSPTRAGAMSPGPASPSRLPAARPDTPHGTPRTAAPVGAWGAHGNRGTSHPPLCALDGRSERVDGVRDTAQPVLDREASPDQPDEQRQRNHARPPTRATAASAAARSATPCQNRPCGWRVTDTMPDSGGFACSHSLNARRRAVVSSRYSPVMACAPRSPRARECRRLPPPYLPPGLPVGG